MNPDSHERRRAERRGQGAENWAALLLLAKGYRPLARRLKTPVGEIDLLVRRGGVLAVVEVKARRTLDQAAEAIPERQWRRIARALEWYLAGRPALAGLTIRFDAVLLAGWRMRHLPDAWRPG